MPVVAIDGESPHLNSATLFFFPKKEAYLKAEAGEKVIEDFVLSVPPTQSTNLATQVATVRCLIQNMIY
jgi:hypothetical protein